MSDFLQEEDPEPFCVHEPECESPFLLVSDHAGKHVPTCLGDMGVLQEDLTRHIAIDIGIARVGQILQRKLECFLIEQKYSRLVIDCNRSLGHRTSIPEVSDGTFISANIALSPEERRQREVSIFHPYHDRINDALRSRDQSETLFVALHSFTPEMQGFERPWHVGVLYEHDYTSAFIMKELLKTEGTLCVGDNEPYVMTSENEYTVPHHAGRRGISALEIEIRQDLISDKTGQEEWADRLARLLPIMWSQKKEKKNG